MKKVGLIGEAPNDTTAFINLFNERFKLQATFFVLVNDIHGSDLDCQKTKRFLRIEYESHKPDVVVFIRDLDALETNKKQLEIRKNYFTEFNSVVNKKGIYLLNIFEIEALILADITSFNEQFKSEIMFTTDPMLQEKPKEFLIENTKHPNKYNESKNPKIFEKLNIDILLKCRYFKTFYENFEALLNNKAA